MSSLINSLSGLASVAKEVETALLLSTEQEHAIRLDRATFERLQHQINELQVAAPNHEGVLKARVRWYGLAVDSFESSTVQPAERGEWPHRSFSLIFVFSNEPTDLLAGTETIDHFLRRHYLKDSFGHFFTRVLALYRRVANAPVAEEVRRVFAGCTIDLEERLLNGRL